MSTQRQKVLLVGRGLGLGGMERLLLAQVRFGDRHRFDYELAYVDPDKDALVPDFERLGAPVHVLSRGRTPWPLALRSLLASSRYDVVHSHSPLVASAVRLIAPTIRPRPRLVYTEHNSWDPYSVPTRWANRLTYRADDAQVAVSVAARASIPPRLRSRVQVIDHGIDLEAVASHRAGRQAARRSLGISDDQVLIGTVANMRPEKNYEGFLRVARAVVERRPHVRFVSIGQGPLLEDMRELSHRLRLDGKVDLIGEVPNAVELMAGFDIFTLASHWEGLPVAFMEARALGLPIAVTRVGGLALHVDDGVDGVLVEPGSDSALVDALLEVVDDDDLRARLGQASLACAATFDARTVVPMIEQRYAPDRASC